MSQIGPSTAAREKLRLHQPTAARKQPPLHPSPPLCGDVLLHGRFHHWLRVRAGQTKGTAALLIKLALAVVKSVTLEFHSQSDSLISVPSGHTRPLSPAVQVQVFGRL
ncbi:hypothetical protein INR49_025428 [Caranx melampygus]|nr:hypothetical protein INR49_025428 [Caranx melampygus]